MRLKYQLFLLMLGASAVLIALMFAISSWSFSRGFLGYINNAAQRQLQPLVEIVAERYKQSGGWDWVEGNPGEWRRLLAQWRPGTNRGPRRGSSVDAPGDASADASGDATGVSSVGSLGGDSGGRQSQDTRSPPPHLNRRINGGGPVSYTHLTLPTNREV